MKKRRAVIIYLSLLAWSIQAMAEIDPAIVGWGNLAVPGLGATLMGKPGQGLAEAGLELGTYFGGTFGVRESSFSIDGSVRVPTTRRLQRPLMGQMLQEFGLKYHFYNTFHHYQQATLAQEVASGQTSKNPQPIYRGDWKDMITAPFSWKNLSSPWVYPLILVSGAYMVYSYKNTTITRLGFRVPASDQAMYGISQTTVIPVTGAIGEEPLFRGFVMRESRAYTGSALAAMLIQSSLFTLVHPPELRASGFASGIYFGMMTNHFDGNIEPAIAAHFWVNVIDGVIAYLALKRAQGENTPFAPPLAGQIMIPF